MPTTSFVLELEFSLAGDVKENFRNVKSENVKGPNNFLQDLKNEVFGFGAVRRLIGAQFFRTFNKGLLFICIFIKALLTAFQVLIKVN